MPLKAELHCHIEGAAAPELVIRQAEKYGKDVSPFIQDGSFVWHDFTSFLAAYDFSADLFRSEEDYARLADHYLTSLARDGAIYSEVFTSPDHAAKAGLSPLAYTNALGEGMARAKAKTGIEGRMIVTGVRHFGVEAIERAARFAARCGHPLVTGFGVAGEERFGDFEDYVRAFEIAREAGLGITVHAGELMGWESVAGRARPYQAVAHRPRRARHRKPRPRQAHRRRRRGARMLPGLQHRASDFRQLREPSLPCAEGGRLQGDAQFGRSALFLDVAEARIRHGGKTFRHE